MALAIKIEVPWDQANQQHACRLELLDSDGQAVLVDTGEGEQPIFIEAGFEVGRPAGVKPGTPIDLPLAINIPPFPLEPSGRYEWRLTIDGESDADWRVVASRPRSRGRLTARENALHLNEAEGQTLFFFGSDPFRRSDCRPKRGAKKCLTQKKGSGTHALGANEAKGQTLTTREKRPDPKERVRLASLLPQPVTLPPGAVLRN